MYPQILTINDGETASFTCISHVKPVWTFEDGPIPLNFKTSTSLMNNLTYIVTIHDVSITNGGYYECEGTDNKGFLFLSRVRLIVASKIPISRALTFSRSFCSTK